MKPREAPPAGGVLGWHGTTHLALEAGVMSTGLRESADNARDEFTTPGVYVGDRAACSLPYHATAVKLVPQSKDNWDVPYSRFLLRVRCYGQSKKSSSYGVGMQSVWAASQVRIADLFVIRGWSFADKGEKRLYPSSALLEVLRGTAPLTVHIRQTVHFLHDDPAVGFFEPTQQQPETPPTCAYTGAAQPGPPSWPSWSTSAAAVSEPELPPWSSWSIPTATVSEPVPPSWTSWSTTTATAAQPEPPSWSSWGTTTATVPEPESSWATTTAAVAELPRLQVDAVQNSLLKQHLKALVAQDAGGDPQRALKILDYRTLERWCGKVRGNSVSKRIKNLWYRAEAVLKAMYPEVFA